MMKEKRISSRTTFMMKYVDPAVFIGFMVWFLLAGGCDNPDHVHPPSSRLLFVMSPLLLIAGFMILNDAITVKTVSMVDGGLLVSGAFRSEVIPLDSIVSASQRRWHKDRRVKLTLKSPCLGKKKIYFMPSTLARLEAEGRLSFWQRFKWHPHPIVDELNQMVKEAGETEEEELG